jgi:hypothetical protein
MMVPHLKHRTRNEVPGSGRGEGIGNSRWVAHFGQPEEMGRWGMIGLDGRTSYVTITSSPANKRSECGE